MIRRDRLLYLLILALVLSVGIASAATLSENLQNTFSQLGGVVDDMYSEGSIFAKFFTVERLVNYVLVFFLLYLIASFVPGIREQFGGWRDNRVMMSIALAGLSVFVVTASITDPKMYFWELSFIQTIRALFVQGRFYVFVMSAVGYYMIFNTWGNEEMKKGPMKIILTIILALETAKSGATKETVFQGLYFIFLFALYKSFGGGEGKAGKSKAMAFGLSFGLVNYIALTAFESYGFGLRWSIGTLLGQEAASSLGYETFIGNFLTGASAGLLLALTKKASGSTAGKLLKKVGKGIYKGSKNTKEYIKNHPGFNLWLNYNRSLERLERIKKLVLWKEKMISILQKDANDSNDPNIKAINDLFNFFDNVEPKLKTADKTAWNNLLYLIDQQKITPEIADKLQKNYDKYIKSIKEVADVIDENNAGGGQ